MTDSKSIRFGSPQHGYRQEPGGRINLSMDPRAEFHRLFMRNTTLATAAAHYGLTSEEMGLALHYARLSKVMSQAARKRMSVAPPPATDESAGTHRWCSQCERRVKAEEANICASPWCKAR